MPRTDAREAIDLSEKKVNSARLMRLRDNQSIIKEMFIPHIVKAICQPEYLVIAAWERKAFGIDDQKPSLHSSVLDETQRNLLHTIFTHHANGGAWFMELLWKKRFLSPPQPL